MVDTEMVDLFPIKAIDLDLWVIAELSRSCLNPPSNQASLAWNYNDRETNPT
jgi:hypothetical protein